MNRILKSYFYWTYPRGSFHYDVMVTLILAFIFVTPHLWDFGDKPMVISAQTRPLMVSGDGKYGLIISVDAADVHVAPGASESETRKALKTAVEPVGGDGIVIERWQVTHDASGQPVAWKVWAHK